ncbi:MAG: hypothetical protein ACRDOK_11525, partial [Streptosporangiaceae bacterium]
MTVAIGVLAERRAAALLPPGCEAAHAHGPRPALVERDHPAPPGRVTARGSPAISTLGSLGCAAFGAITAPAAGLEEPSRLLGVPARR